MHRRLIGLAVLAVLAVLVAVPAATPAPGVDSSALRNAVTVNAIKAHEAKFQQFANASTTAFGFPTRVDGSVGFTKSVDYVASKMRSYGYSVTLQDFTFDRFVLNSSAFQQVSPTATTYTEGTDYEVMEYSGAGDVTAPVAAAGGIVIPSPGGVTSGCASADFNGFPAGSIALIQRGTCTFREKADNAKTAGAVGVIIFNEGNSADRTGLINGTLGAPQFSLPTIDTTFALGQQLFEASKKGLTVRIAVDASALTTLSQNVIADSPTGRADRTVVVGAHLDSVTDGPGINDNGSGSASILEVAKQMSALGTTNVNRVRFAFWGGEEFGLLGSEYYVSHLPKAELKNIALNLNFDMVASPNFVRFVYDGDGSGTGTKGPTGSGNIEQVFTSYFASLNLATDPTAFDGRSDYGPFIDRGIPAGGLFTGAEGIKTAAQAVTYGGTAGQPYDSCYHQACDSYPSNLNLTALDQMSDAIAHSVLTFALTSSSVSGTDKAGVKTDWKGNHRVR
jgi:Zn-dependent M28 family amino/carboxypeptidase